MPGPLGDKELALVLATEGMLPPNEAQELALLAADTAQTHAIVEVGSYRGRSTAALALGSVAGNSAPVFAVEPHERFRGPLGGEFGPADRREFFSNLLAAGAVEHVRLINLSSALRRELRPWRVIEELMASARFEPLSTVGQLAVLRKLR